VTATAQPGTPPPGWYWDGWGPRWWDGTTWGPYAPAAPIDPIEQGKVLAVLSHIGFFVAGFLLPLVIRVTEGEKNEYAKHHSTEALNFNITFLLAWLAGFVLFFVSAGISAATDTVPWGFFVVFPLLMLLWVGSAACAVVGAVRASQRRWWRYPVSIRFVRGARAEERG
jgi:uncharacterized Tic20 family protein